MSNYGDINKFDIGDEVTNIKNTRKCVVEEKRMHGIINKQRNEYIVRYRVSYHDTGTCEFVPEENLRLPQNPENTGDKETEIVHKIDLLFKNSYLKHMLNEHRPPEEMKEYQANFGGLKEE